jgi:hypothetical protein
MRSPVERHSEGAEQVVREIRRAVRRQFSAEEKVRIVIAGLRGEERIAELCRKEGINQNLYCNILALTSITLTTDAIVSGREGSSPEVRPTEVGSSEMCIAEVGNDSSIILPPPIPFFDAFLELGEMFWVGHKRLSKW